MVQPREDKKIKGLVKKNDKIDIEKALVKKDSVPLSSQRYAHTCTSVIPPMYLSIGQMQIAYNLH